MRTQLRTRGEWPDLVRLRKGWSSARARPWNDQTRTIAALRLDRGNDQFLRACVRWLEAHGVEQTLTPALPRAQTKVWRRAGFRDHLRLVVFERDLSESVGPTLYPVEIEDDPDMVALAAIDDRAFPPTWRVGRQGLVDAVTATPLADVLVVKQEGAVGGFAVVGELSGVSYLQRLAVDPDFQRRGIGRALVRACLTWARKRGALTMMLNTQPENFAASTLYESEGFVSFGPRLQVLTRHSSHQS